MGNYDGWTDKTRAELLELLGEDQQQLVTRLFFVTVTARWELTDQGWWYGRRGKKIQQLADQLEHAIADLDDEIYSLEPVFNHASRHIFDEKINPFKMTLKQAEAANLTQEQWRMFQGAAAKYGDQKHLARFRSQLRFLARPVIARGRGRQREEVREFLACAAAFEFLTHGFKPSKSNNGVFADVLRILLREAHLYVPTDMYPVVEAAVDSVVEKLRSEDPETAQKVFREARQPRRKRTAKNRVPVGH